MTYQSSPMYPIIFPEQAHHLNRFGVQPLPGNYVKHAEILPAGHEAHPSWKVDAHHAALAKVANTKKWQNEMLRGMPSVKGHAGTTHRYRFDKEFYTQLSGGRSSEADDEINQLLQDRVEQYGAIDRASFFDVPSYRLDSNLRPSDTAQIDSMLSSLISSINGNVISKPLLTLVSNITNAITSMADKISSSKLGEYAQTIAETNNLILDVIETRNDYVETPENQRILSSLYENLQELFNFIKKMEAYSSAPSKIRATALASERAKLLNTARKNIKFSPGRAAIVAEPIDTSYISAPGWQSSPGVFASSSPTYVSATGGPLTGEYGEVRVPRF